MKILNTPKGMLMEQEKKDKFIELRAQGLSFDAISKQLNISKPTLIKLERELSDEVQWCKFIHIESLAEKYKMLRAARLERLLSVLERVNAAVESADYEKLSPDKRVELQHKLEDRAIKEMDYGYTQRGGLSEVLRDERERMSDYILEVLD